MTNTTEITNAQILELPESLTFRVNTKPVNVYAHGDDLTASSSDQRWDSFFLNGPMVSDDFMTDRESQLLAIRTAAR